MTRARDVANIDGVLTTTGDTYYASAAATPARLGIGSTGQVLTVSGGVPSWATPAGGGGYTQLATGNLTGSSVSINSISQSYKKLVLVMNNVSLSANDQLAIRVNNYSTGDYALAALENTTSTQGGAGYSVIKLTYTNMDNTSAGCNFILQFDDYAQTSAYLTGTFYGTYIATASVIKTVTGSWGYLSANAAISSLQLLANYGGAYTFDSGTYTLYGVK